MRILAIVSHKGGAARTTSAVFLAEALAAQGRRVLLADADRQRAAGLLVGVDRPTGQRQSCALPGVSYLCVTLRDEAELAACLGHLDRRFDVAVVDTPSLDDRLARACLCLSHGALVVVPVEPLAVRTLDAALAGVGKVLGILPTLFDASSPTQLEILHDLRAGRLSDVLPRPVPFDEVLARSGAPEERRCACAQPATRDAYRIAAARVAHQLGLDRRRSPAAGLFRALLTILRMRRLAASR